MISVRHYYYGLLTLSALASAALFPWPFTALLALAVSLGEPLVPLAVGIVIDTLYYTPQAQVLPLFTICGALTTVVIFLVRSRLETSTIGR